MLRPEVRMVGLKEGGRISISRTMGVWGERWVSRVV